jgi:hypothetical protein
MNHPRTLAVALVVSAAFGCGVRYRETRQVPLPSRAVKIDDSIHFETVKAGSGAIVSEGVCFGETATLLSHERIGEGQEQWRGITSFDDLQAPQWRQFYRGFKDGEVRRVWERRRYRSGWAGVKRDGIFVSEIAVSGVAPCHGG